MRIKIGDQILDSNNDVIAQTYAVNEIGNISTRQGGYSNDFTLPLTAKNQAILGAPDNINTSSRKPYQKVSASLIDQGTVVAEGYLKIKSVVGNTVTVSFFSDNVEWFSLIKDKKLADLDLEAYDHTWDYTTIATAINADKSSGYTYPLVDYGEFSDNTDFDIFSNQLYPGMFVSTIVSQIFEDVSWKVDGEMINHPLYKRMFIPFSGKTFSNSDQFISDHTNSVALTGSLSGTTIEIQINNSWSGVDIDTNYDVTITIGYSAAPTPGDYTVRLKLDAVTVGTQVVPSSSVVVGNQTTITFTNIPASEADTITITAQLASGATNFTIDSSASSMTFTPPRELTSGSYVEIANTLPDIQQADLIKYLAFCFGAIPQANNNSKTVSFGLFNSIKNNIPNALNWSSKIDLSKTREIDFTELLSNYKSTSILTYREDDNDNELKAYEAESKQRFGQGQITIDNEHIRGSETIYEAPFSPMINITSFDNQIYIPQIRFKVTGEDDLEPEPKIGILSENISISDLTAGATTRLRIQNDPDEYVTNYEDVTSIPFLWFAKTQNVTAVDALLDSLAFDQVLIPAIGEPLRERFLSDYEEILNSVKYTKGYFHLTEVDINSLDFTIPVYIDFFKSYFYISRINNFTGSRSTTECELVKIGKASGEEVEIPANIDGMQDNDLVFMEDLDGEIMIDL